MTRAGIYVRISSDPEGLAEGVKRQEKDCRDLCERRGWEVAEPVYSDNDVSATKGDRPEWNRLLADLKAGRIQAVAAYSTSRLYRQISTLHPLMELAKEHGVKIDTVVDGRIDFSTATSRMVANILASVAQHEAEVLGERSARAKADLKDKGGWLGGGNRAYGYEYEKRPDPERGDKVKVFLLINEDEADVLREAARRILPPEPETLGRVVRDLNARGIRTSKDGLWSPSRLRNLLTSPLHAGRFADGTEGNWPPILTADQHRLLKALLPRQTGGGRGSGQAPTRKYALSGLLRCSECGRPLLGSDKSYRCQTWNGGCGRVRAVSYAVDAAVEKATWAREETWAADPARNPTGPPADASDALLAELHSLEARRLGYVEDAAAGVLSREDFRSVTEAIARKTAEVEAHIREAAPAQQRYDFAWVLEQPSPLEQNEFYSQFIDHITVRPATRRGWAAAADIPGRLEITWRS